MIVGCPWRPGMKTVIRLSRIANTCLPIIKWKNLVSRVVIEKQQVEKQLVHVRLRLPFPNSKLVTPTPVPLHHTRSKPKACDTFLFLSLLEFPVGGMLVDLK